MSELQCIFEKSERQIHKWLHYFAIYERHFDRIRSKARKDGRKVRLLEIGVGHGGSLDMWNKYFEGNIEIFGIDIEPKCKKFDTTSSGGNIHIFIGQQEDVAFLQSFKQSTEPFDIIIDDGGHHMKQQIVTFEHLYSHVINDGGIFLIEDLHTSYWGEYRSGYKHPSSFIEYMKNYIDQINAFHSQTPELQVNEFTRVTHAISFYDSVIVLEKCTRITDKPRAEVRGTIKLE